MDAFLFDWISGRALKREWFFERLERQLLPHGKPCLDSLGNCADVASRRGSVWRVGRPHVVVSEATFRTRRPTGDSGDRRRRELNGATLMPPAPPAPKPQNICKICGASSRPDQKYCGSWAPIFQGEQIRKLLIRPAR